VDKAAGMRGDGRCGREIDSSSRLALDVRVFPVRTLLTRLMGRHLQIWSLFSLETSRPARSAPTGPAEI
jgi:hypothetical protein